MQHPFYRFPCVHVPNYLYNAAMTATTAPRATPMEPAFFMAALPLNEEGVAVVVPVLRFEPEDPVAVATILVLNPALATDVTVAEATLLALVYSLIPGLPISAAVLPDVNAEVAAEVASEVLVVEATDDTDASVDTDFAAAVVVAVVEAVVAEDLETEVEVEDEEDDEDEDETAEQLRSYRGVVLSDDPTTPKLGAVPASSRVYHQILVLPNRGQPTSSQ